MSEEKGKYKIDGRPATIFRTIKDKNNPYAMVDMRPILNSNLSWKAKGILVYLLSRPDGWEVNLTDLVKRSTDGLASVKAGVKELKEVGHLKHAGIRKASGQFDTVIWEVYEAPQVGNQLTDKPQVVVPEVENQPTVSPQVDYPQAEKPQAGNRIQVLKTLSSNDLKNKSALSTKDFEVANKKVDAILENDRKAIEKMAGGSWVGRESLPEPIRELLDFYVKLTGQKPTKGMLMDWNATAGEWLEIGITTDDLREAYKKANPEKGTGFFVARPGSLTSVAGMIAGKRRGNREITHNDPMATYNQYLERKQNAQSN